MKHTTETYICVNSHDLEAFVRCQLNIEYSYDAANGCRSGTVHTYRVTEELADWEIEEAEQFLAGDDDHYGSTVLDALRLRGLIEPGSYLVRVL